MVLSSVFARVVLVLAAIGIYGLMSYSVHQRTQEIGIRMALDAGRSNMLNLVLKPGMMLAAVGLVLGLTLAYEAVRDSLLFGVKGSDPQMFGAVSAICDSGLVGGCISRSDGLQPSTRRFALRYE